MLFHKRKVFFFKLTPNEKPAYLTKTKLSLELLFGNCFGIGDALD